MKIANQINKIVYEGTKEEMYEVYELCHQLQLRVPGFYCHVTEIDDKCYLEILIENWMDYVALYGGKKEESDRVKEFCGSYWKAEE